MLTSFHIAICGRVFTLEPLHNAVRDDLRLRDRDSGLQPPIGMKKSPVPVAGRFRHIPELRRHRDWNPEIKMESAHAAVEIWRRDSYDGERPVGNFHDAANHLRVAAKTALPQAMAENDHVVPAGMRVFIR